jgi:hypothetical protein
MCHLRLVATVPFILELALALTARHQRRVAPEGLLGIGICQASVATPMGRGCCSWHGGECGCQGGRELCCDGSLSPTCTCHQARPAGDSNSDVLETGSL